MRPTLPLSLLAVVAAIGISACSNSSNAAANSTDQNAATSAAADNGAASDNTAASDNAAASDNTAANAAASTAPADAGTTAAPPVYPGATAGTRPKGVADGAPPQVKAYVTADGMVTVRTWYKAHLKGASELGAPDNDKNKDVFLVGQGPSGQVVMLQNVGGKTWVVIGPGFPK
jgi:cytoskeletal protein RodZ